MFRPSDDQDPLGVLQRAAFTTVTVDLGSGKEEVPAIEAYFSCLGRSAAKGSGSASRELMRLMRFFGPQISLGDGLRDPEAGKFMRERFESQRRMTSKLAYYRGMAFLAMVGAFQEAYEKKNADIAGFLDLIPDYCDLQTLSDRLPSAIRALRRRRPKTDYEIGYKKPPAGTRWPKGQCGRASAPVGPAETVDPRRAVFRAFISALTQSVTVTTDGKRSRRPSLEVAVRQVFKKAIGGDKESARLVRTIIEMLHEHSRLVAPDLIPARPRVKQQTPEQIRDTVVLNRVMTWVMMPDVKADMIKIYEARWGQVDISARKFKITPPTKRSVNESDLPRRIKLGLIALLSIAKVREAELQAARDSFANVFEDAEILGPNFDGNHDVSISDQTDMDEPEILRTPRKRARKLNETNNANKTF